MRFWKAVLRAESRFAVRAIPDNHRGPLRAPLRTTFRFGFRVLWFWSWVIFVDSWCHAATLILSNLSNASVDSILYICILLGYTNIKYY